MYVDSLKDVRVQVVKSIEPGKHCRHVMVISSNATAEKDASKY